MTSTTTTETTIQPIDLAAERAAVGPALHEAVLRVIDSGRYVLGPEVEALERDFAKMHGVAHGVGVATGTDALWLGLLALGVQPGDHVVTTPFTFFASAASIALVGAKPILADVEYDTALIDPRAVEKAIDAKTTAILPVHLYGQLCDMRALKAIADKRKLRILEDGAQAHGAKRDGYGCGGVGDAGTFSFYVTKNLGAAGEGGMIVTNSEATAKSLRELRDHGSPTKYVHARIGTNSRLHALQAAILNVKLPHLERWNARRRVLAARYDAAFRGSTTIAPMKLEPGSTHCYHQYAVRIRGSRPRDEVMKLLGERKINTAVHYPSPVHVQAAAKPWGYGPGDFPNAERLAREVLCLPIHPFLSDADVDRVAENLIHLAPA
ncbi:MAG TPA: DegT/DnrJ/EryC1/StrS family aminotransferase [Planctomycetota bacterium]|nr:DegT/DnrJ/EryC1/StrS family aminotransferase [Planctomycetota bacterium]